jgi:hypothetical protein
MTTDSAWPIYRVFLESVYSLFSTYGIWSSLLVLKYEICFCTIHVKMCWLLSASAWFSLQYINLSSRHLFYGTITDSAWSFLNRIYFSIIELTERCSIYSVVLGSA